jgi:hypothetical protein
MGTSFDTKIAILVASDLAVWQKLNVTAFLATGIAAAVPEAMGQPYEDAEGHRFSPLLGQPMLIFSATPEIFKRAWDIAIARELTRAVYVRAMFATGDDEANRAAFLAEPAGALDLVGLALRGSKKAIEKVTKGVPLHP